MAAHAAQAETPSEQMQVMQLTAALASSHDATARTLTCPSIRRAGPQHTCITGTVTPSHARAPPLSEMACFTCPTTAAAIPPAQPVTTVINRVTQTFTGAPPSYTLHLARALAILSSDREAARVMCTGARCLYRQ